MTPSLLKVLNCLPFYTHKLYISYEYCIASITLLYTLHSISLNFQCIKLSYIAGHLQHIDAMEW